MTSEKARALRNEILLDSLLLTDVIGLAQGKFIEEKFAEMMREGEALAADFDALAKGKSNPALAMALTTMLMAFGRNFEKHKREAPRVVMPDLGSDMGFGKKRTQ